MSGESALDRSFVRHVAGMMAFMEWQERWKEVSRDLRWKGPLLELHDVASQRWGLACPRHPGAASHPTLLVQSEERRWLERIAWADAVFDRDQGRLALVSKAWETPAGHWPAFAVVLQVNPADKWAWLASTGVLEARPLWWDSSDEAHISHGPAAARWAVTGVPSENWHATVDKHLAQAQAEPASVSHSEEGRIKALLQPRGERNVGSW
jgi:hypothetical protein